MEPEELNYDSLLWDILRQHRVHHVCIASYHEVYKYKDGIAFALNKTIDRR